MGLLETGGDMVSRKCFTSMVVAVAMLSVAAAAAQSKKGRDTADQKEFYNYVLTMDKVQKLGNATKALSALAARYPDLPSGSSDQTLDEITQRFQEHPDAMAILNKNGLTPREWVVGTMTLSKALMAVGLKRSGTYKEYPPDMLKAVSPANLAFVEKHYDEVRKGR
jgi:hypothetical protein